MPKYLYLSLMKSNVLIIKNESTGSRQIYFNGLKNWCEEYGVIKYNSIKHLKFPFTYKGYIFQKMPW